MSDSLHYNIIIQYGKWEYFARPNGMCVDITILFPCANPYVNVLYDVKDSNVCITNLDVFSIPL